MLIGKELGFVRKYLSADGLIKIVQQSIQKEAFKSCRSEYSWEDCLMAGLAIFGFKMPSLLQFEKNKSDMPIIRRNLRTLYGVEKAPSASCLRERLDTVDPRQLRGSFKKIFSYPESSSENPAPRANSGATCPVTFTSPSLGL